MTHLNELCFEEHFLRWFMRGGGALCAESEAWGKLEQAFGRTYVPHLADEEILKALSERADDPNAGFLLVLIGMPGSGKTLLLKEFVEGLSYSHFSNNYKPIINKITGAFEFRDVAQILPFNERTKKGDYPTTKRVVWVTTTVDDFVDISVEAKESLRDLERKLKVGLGKGESLIIFGNRGVLGDVISKDDPVIHSIYGIVAVRNQRFEFVRIPKESNVFWIKQFGVDEPLFNLTNGLDGFKQYSISLIVLGENYLQKCSQGRQNHPECQGCIADSYLKYINELKEMLRDNNFTARVHDLLFFLWLRHCDLYLTPRSLNLFWGYCLYNLWKIVEQEEQRGNGNAIDKSLIYDALYLSRVPSIRGPEEYSLSEAKVHKYRDERFESKILGLHGISHLNKDRRRRERLKLFFSNENVRYKEMIDDGALEEYLDSSRLLSKMGQVLLRLVLMRPLSVISRKLGEAISLRWTPEKLLFSPIVELVQKSERTGQKARRLPVVMFDDKLIRDITYHGFRMVNDDIRYLEMREKVLELDVEVQDKPPKSPSYFNLNLQDYEVLRDFASKIREPDLSLSPRLKRKVRAFLRSLDGIADYLVAPLMYDYLKERSRRNDEVGLFLYSLKHGKDCDAKFGDDKMRVSIDTENYTIELGGRK
jgi:hypothetical protein